MRLGRIVDPHSAPTPTSDRPDLPRPLSRRGPRPLLLHLWMAHAMENACEGGSPDWKSAWLNWSAGSGFSAERDTHPTELPKGMRLDGRLIAGIAAYRRHPFYREERDPPAIWSDGAARLLDYAPDATGPVVLFVPSLINRGYVLDLSGRWSMLRFLAAHGVRPLLLDWGWPGEIELGFSLADYIVGLLERAIEAAGAPVVLAGYCLGGVLAAAMAQRRPDLVRALALLATPWDFSDPSPQPSLGPADLLPWLEPMLQLGGSVPVDVLQALFALRDPVSVAQKFRRFADLDQDSAAARRFVAIEDWLSDGVPLAAAVARECFGTWYGHNAPMAGAFRVAGMAVAPETLRMPCFAAIPTCDRIVPAASARALVRLLAEPHIIEPASGHVSMVAGARAETVLWRPLLDWVCALGGSARDQ